MYVRPNYKTKKEFKAAVAAGVQHRPYDPAGMHPAPDFGVEFVEGPHFPAAHTWYAQVELRDGIVVKVR